MGLRIKAEVRHCDHGSELEGRWGAHTGVPMVILTRNLRILLLYTASASPRASQLRRFRALCTMEVISRSSASDAGGRSKTSSVEARGMWKIAVAEKQHMRMKGCQNPDAQACSVLTFVAKLTGCGLIRRRTHCAGKSVVSAVS